MFNRVRRRSTAFVLVLIGLAGCGDAEASKKAAVLASIVGDWHAPDEDAVLSVHADGAYTWGKLQGKFAGLDAQRVSMTFMENGKWKGGIPQTIALSGDTLSMVAPDKSVMLFLRVTP